MEAEKPDFRAIEKKWQQRWEKEGIFRAKESRNKRKYYVLEMYPYPSASFLHMGHVRNYTIGDVHARFKRMQGFNVLYPMGYDSFGLPAETAAKKEGVHPAKYTEHAISKIMEYQKALGNSYDWGRVISSHDVDYYKWNQYFFLKLYEKGLAYRKKALVNWCPECESVLANEEAEGGKCWRCGSEVVKKDMEQWFFKITAYADRLLKDLKKVAWPEKIKKMQTDWVGRSEGVDIHFKLGGTDKILPTFTTRCDTIFSVTFLGIAPEHPMIDELVKGTKYKKGAKDFVKKMLKQSLEDRINEEKEKEGFFTGKYAVNPVNGEKVPIYIANFAVMYGSGIVMCDAHDKRDFRFARKYKIPLKFVISKDGKPIEPKDYDDAFTDDGVLFNSGKFSGMSNREALPKIADWLEEKKFGKKAVNYKMRDWMVSRQRYWGTPIPIIHCAKCGIVPVPEKDLPVLLPEKVDFKAAGNPLAANKEFMAVKCPKCRGAAKRETDTMGGFMDSSWYFLRYCSPKEKEFAFSKNAVRYWMPVDQYIGGAEHAVMHLLYARFFIKALKDMGFVSFDEPFTRLFNQGILYKDGHKMSKSFGNVVTQDEISKKCGTDTARLFLMFVSSPESQMEWSDEGITGAYRFVLKLWSLVNESRKLKTRSGRLETRDLTMRARLHSAIKKVTETMESFKYNITIGTLMELLNEMQKYLENPHKEVFKESLDALILMLSPFAPHICEEAWEIVGGKGFISLAKWPAADETLIDRKLEMMGELVEATKADIKEVLKIIGREPKSIKIYVAPLWKYTVYNEIIEKAQPKHSSQKAGETSLEVGVKEVLKAVMRMPEARIQGKHAAMFAEKLAKGARMLKGVLTQEEELKALEESRQGMEKLFSCGVKIMKAEASKSLKAARAEPGKPGIEVE